MTVPFSEQLEVIERDGTRDPDTRRWKVTESNRDTFQGQVSPASGDDLELLDEGERTGDEKVVHTERQLKTSDEDQDPPVHADHVVIDGDRYEVSNVKEYRAVKPHYEAVCTKV